MNQPSLSSNEWNLSTNPSPNSDPLGIEAQNFIYENCQWVVYFRKDPRFLCTAHYDLARQSKEDYNIKFCPKCWGLGIATTPQIVPARVILGRANLSVRQTDSRLEPGYIAYNTANIDFPRNVRPALEDIVLVCDWNKTSESIATYPTGRPLNIVDMYLIKVVNTHYERESAWSNCGAEKVNYLRDWGEAQLPYLYKAKVLQKEVWAQQNIW